MAKIIKYKFLSCAVNHGTEENPNIEQIILDKSIKCSTQVTFDATYPIAEREAIPGTIEVSGEFDYPTATRNILEGEYATVSGILYKAIMNIPNGEPIIVGQNATITTVEEQLAELAKGD